MRAMDKQDDNTKAKRKPTMIEKLRALGFNVLEPTCTGLVIGTGGKR